jgi:hypothetical protein
LATVEAIDAWGGGVSKIRGGLEDLGIVSEETANKLRKVEGAADIMVGSAQISIVALEAWKRATDAQKFAMIELGLVTAAVWAAYGAFTAQSNAQRIAFSLLTGITAGLAAAKFTLALAEASAAIAAAGPAAPIVAGLIGGGLAAGAVYWAATKAKAEGQTAIGEEREFEVRQSGIVEVHQGERMRLSREGEGAANLGRPRRGSGANINVTLVGNFNLNDPVGVRRTGEQLGDYLDRYLGGVR